MTSRAKRWHWQVVTVVVVLAAIRLLAFDLPKRNEPSDRQLAKLRESDVLQSPALPHTGVSVFQFQRFDPDAIVYLTCGKDGAPGIEGFDDDQDESLDNYAEIGAVSSDDQCVAAWQAGYAEAATLPQTKRIRGGCYVACGEVDAERWILSGRIDGRVWTWTFVR